MVNLMPVPASEWADRIDFINWLITVIAVFCTFTITGVMLYFAVRYRRRTDHDETPYLTHNATIETVWTVIPTVIVIYLFWYGYSVYSEMRTPPSNAIEINVTGQKWSWSFEYPNGKQGVNELVVPLGEPIRLIMRSKDVIHSFYIPAMRIKEDVLANTYSYEWFTATKTGEFHIFCAEYCGDGHSAMLATLKVVTPAQYNDFLIDRSGGEEDKRTPEEKGAAIYSKNGCKTCHSIDGSAGVGPSFKGIYGKPVDLESGTPVTVDETYVRESILNPTAKVVKGFKPVMPPQVGLSDTDINDLIAYIKSLK